MPRERKRARRWQIIAWSILIIPFILYLVSFWGDFIRVLTYLWRVFFWLLFGRSQALPMPGPEVANSIGILLFTILLGFGVTFFIWLLLVSFQALLPIQSLDEVFETMAHQIFYLLRSHGQAIFVLDGKMDHTADELKRPGPGVVVVNFNSAIVLETMVRRGSCLMAPIYRLRRLIRWMFNLRPGPSSRVAGPGLVFTSGEERIRAVVDLRPQSRAAKERINAYTRDGIEVDSKVTAIFTIGQRPDVIELAYQDERQAENLKIITTRRTGNNQVEVTSHAEDALNPEDLEQAHRYARVPNQYHDAQPYAAVERPRLAPEFDEARVFGAVYAQARNPQEEPVPWTELPAQVAAEVFQHLIQNHNYNDLYALDQPEGSSFPMAAIKRSFRNQLRNTGLLWFRIVFHRSLTPLQDGVYNQNDLLVSPYIAFTSPQLLRDRGIKVLAAAFSSPLPVDPEIYRQRLAHWRIEWERDTALKRAAHELEATRIRNHARAQAQEDLTAALSLIFQRGEASDEVMALRVLQALEGVAADPLTRRLLPSETITMMNTLHNWLLPDEASKAAAAISLRSLPPSPPPPPPAPAFPPPDFSPPDDVPPPPPLDAGV